MGHQFKEQALCTLPMSLGFLIDVNSTELMKKKVQIHEYGDQKDPALSLSRHVQNPEDFDGPK